MSTWNDDDDECELFGRSLADGAAEEEVLLSGRLLLLFAVAGEEEEVVEDRCLILDILRGLLLCKLWLLL
jgi:hypothetical protein